MRDTVSCMSCEWTPTIFFMHTTTTFVAPFSVCGSFWTLNLTRIPRPKTILGAAARCVPERSVVEKQSCRIELNVGHSSATSGKRALNFSPYSRTPFAVCDHYDVFFKCTKWQSIHGNCNDDCIGPVSVNRDCCSTTHSAYS
jgi:hypothetical protein